MKKTIIVYLCAASACFGEKHEGVMTAAANEDALWHRGDACGKVYKVRCVGGTNQGVARPCKKGKTVTVKIIDLCPSNGCQATIDLSREAFAHIADPDEGIINIAFEEYVMQRFSLT
ncbi:unnamed protein product [Linum tenue]|uniref:Expansin-like EG45 domain-containing protein n=1 Tax=Linum tenue TaxID=586396 RepID=A0AAV0LYP9_9ROSI|nr:unnamed protein product [Linum tenue]